MSKLLAVVPLIAGLLAFQTPVVAQSKNAVPVAVSGTTSTGGTFQGVLDISEFAIQDGRLVATGLLTGTVRDSAGNIVRSLVSAVSTQVQQTSSASCEILHLELGPLNLDLLGLVVQTNQIVLDIKAQPGPGNLLGNLLCSITNLLNPDKGLVNTLNNLLRTLSRLGA